MEKRYNKPIPFGWYAVEYSNKLEVGEVKPLQYFGEDLVLFRTESGEAKVLDAYCPHLGAHLGIGGKVVGESVSCPFHAWEFDGTGTVTEIPYANKIPPKVKGKPCIRSYPTQEINQMIWVWYHPEEAAPMWDIKLIPEIGKEGWSELDIYEWEIKSIIQETGENAADTAHFVTVHSVPVLPDAVVKYEDHLRSTIFDTRTHMIQEDGTVDNEGEDLEYMRLESFNIGPGQTYQRFFRMFEIAMMATVTPIDDQTIKLRFNFTVPNDMAEDKAVYTAGFVKELVHQVEQDIPIWENKIYKATPILCDGDGPIGQYRKWFVQFYAETPEVKIEKEKKEDLIATV